jgi:hypothetical protein
MRVCYRKDDDFLVANAVHEAKGELVKDVSAAMGDIGRPAFGGFCNRRYRPLKFVLKI